MADSAPAVYHHVAKVSDVDEDEVIDVAIGTRQLALYNLGGRFYATDGICTHAYAPLADGYVEDGVIECPLHGGCFDIRTGAAVGPPCTEGLATYPVRLDGDDVLVGIPAG